MMNVAEALEMVQREEPMDIELGASIRCGGATVHLVDFSGEPADISLPIIVEDSGSARIVSPLTDEWFSLLGLFLE